MSVLPGRAKVIVFGTGYAGLTKVLVSRLVTSRLLEHAWFLVPKLGTIVEFCRGKQKSDLPMKVAATGFNAFVPGVKQVNGLRMAGNDVFGSGLVDQIEKWIGATPAAQDRRAATSSDEAGPLRYQALRLKFVGSLTGSSVSITFAADGGGKLWVRKGAYNLPEMGDAITMLHQLRHFDVRTEAPKWSEDAAL